MLTRRLLLEPLLSQASTDLSSTGRHSHKSARSSPTRSVALEVSSLSLVERSSAKSASLSESLPVSPSKASTLSVPTYSDTKNTTTQASLSSATSSTGRSKSR